MRTLVVLALTLTAVGCSSPSTDDWLLQLKDPEVVKRRQAIRELGSRKEESDQIIPALKEALGDESLYVRRDAARSLSTFGASAQSAMPDLYAALKDPAPAVRTAAAAALKKIHPDAEHDKTAR